MITEIIFEQLRRYWLIYLLIIAGFVYTGYMYIRNEKLLKKFEGEKAELEKKKAELEAIYSKKVENIERSLQKKKEAFFKKEQNN